MLNNFNGNMEAPVLGQATPTVSTMTQSKGMTSMKNRTIAGMLLILSGMLLWGEGVWATPDHPGMPEIPGQSRTLLPNGSVLLLWGAKMKRAFVRTGKYGILKP